MTNQEFIESGLLELYAAGALAPSEQEEVARMVAAHPEVKAELEAITATLERYAGLHALKPRPGLRDEILASLPGAQVEGEEARTVPFVPAPTESVVDPDFVAQDLRQSEEEETGGRRPAPYGLALAAAVALLLVSVGVNVYMFRNWQRTEDRLTAALAREQQLAQTFRTMESQLTLRGKELAVVRDQAFREVRLQGKEASPNSSAVVYWNPQNNEVYLDVRSLPPPPSGFQYQLWALDNGQPIDAGMLPVEETELRSLQPMKNIKQAQAFAVTLEPEGGSQSPTLDKMYLMGEG